MEKKESIKLVVLYEIYKFLEPREWFSDIKLVNKLSGSEKLHFQLLIQYIENIEGKQDIIKKKIPYQLDIFLPKDLSWRNQLILFPKEILLKSKNVDKTLSIIKELFILNGKLLLPSKNLGQINLNQKIKEKPSLYEFMNNLELEPIESSSTDFKSQSIWNTLSNTSDFWSTIGYESSSSVDYLIFKCTDHLSLISTISLKNYKSDVYHPNDPVYGAKKLKISIGFQKDKFHYISPEFDLENTNQIQIFHLYPIFVLGTYIRFDFIGKYSTQASDLKYYIAIDEVFVYGLHLKRIMYLDEILCDYLIENNIMDSELFAYLKGPDSYLNSEYFINKWSEFLELMNVVKHDISKKLPVDDKKINLHHRLMSNIKNTMENFNQEETAKMIQAFTNVENNMVQNQPVVLDSAILQNQVFNALMQEVNKTVIENPGIDIQMLMETNQDKPKFTEIPNDEVKMIELKEFIRNNPLFFAYAEEKIFKILNKNDYERIVKIPEKSIEYRLRKDIDLILKFEKLDKRLIKSEIISYFNYYHITDKKYTANQILKILKKKNLNEEIFNNSVEFLFCKMGLFCVDKYQFVQQFSKDIERIIDINRLYEILKLYNSEEINQIISKIFKINSNLYVKLSILGIIYKNSKVFIDDNQIDTNNKRKVDCLIF